MKYLLISFSSMILGFAAVYVGLSAFDHVNPSKKYSLESVPVATSDTGVINPIETPMVQSLALEDETDQQIDIPVEDTASTTIKTNITIVEPDPIIDPVLEKPIIQKAKETILKVPLYVQEFKNSCEAASLRMALAFKNINTNTDMELIQKFGYNPVKKDIVNNTWSDPQKEFVGFVDERCSDCGYGVYGIPVTKTARSYGLDAIYLTEVIPSILAEELHKNNPIVIWGYTSLSNPYTWNTPSGDVVKAFKGTHTRVLTGFRGEKDNPIGFYVHDPLSGQKNEYWSTTKLITHMNAVPGVTNQMVVIR